MSGNPEYYITRSTTILQIDSSTAINPIVYLSSLNSPGALITIRDVAGAVNYNATAPPATNNIITLSTTQGITFLDGGGPSNNIYRITQPYGFLTVIPKTSTIWGVLNTFAFPDATAAANIQNLTASSITASNSYLRTAYISTATISTIAIASIQTPQLIASSLVASTTTSFYTYANILQTSSILASTILAPQIYTSSIVASTTTSFYTYSPVIETSSILASTIFAPVIQTSSILASSLTSFYTYSPVIETSSILASTIFVTQANTSSILASTLTSVYTYSPVIQTSSILASTISASNIISPSITSPQANTSSILASTLKSFYTYTNNLQTSSILASTLQVYGNVNVVSDSSQKLWVAVGQGSPAIRYSSDAIVWNNATGNVFNNSAYAVDWNGSMWVAVGEFSGGSTIRFSYDGIIWNRATVGIFGGYGYGVAWNGRIWVAVGDEGGLTTTIKYSNDGIIWNDVSSTGFTVWGNGIAWNGYMWVAVGQGGSTIRYSYDGLTWSNASSGEFSSFGAGIAWNGAIWVAVGAGGGSTIKYSYDGINWNSGQNVFSISGSGVAWNGSIWVAVGNGGSIKYSRDGIIWYNASSSGDGLFSGYGVGISWNGSLWVAVGFGTVTIKYSKDGIVWSNSTSGLFINEGFGVANNYSVLPDYSAKELNLYLKGQPVFLTSTNQILATLSSIVINNTLYIDKTSNRVGINVAPNANYALDVNGSGRLSNVITPIIDVSESCRVLSELYVGSSNAPQSAVLRFTSLLGGTYIQSGSNLTTGSVAPLFFTGINGSPSWMVLTSNGRLGIGTTTPSYPLDVTGDIRATGVFRGNGSGLTNLPATINSFASQTITVTVSSASNGSTVPIFLNTLQLTSGVSYLVTAEISFRRTGSSFDGSFFYFTTTSFDYSLANLIGIPYVSGYANNVMDLGGAGNPYGGAATSMRSSAQAVVTNGIISLWCYSAADDTWTYSIIISAIPCNQLT